MVRAHATTRYWLTTLYRVATPLKLKRRRRRHAARSGTRGPGPVEQNQAR